MKPRHAAALALLGLYLTTLPTIGSGASTPAPPAGDQITIDGCWHKSDVSYFIFTVKSFKDLIRDLHSSGGAPSISYNLAGDTSKLDDLGPYVRISGTFLRNDKGNDPVGTIQVKTVKELAVPDAKLNPSISRVASWRKYEDSGNGISYWLPDTFPTDESSNSVEPNFVGQTKASRLAEFEIPNDSWGASDFASGVFAIYVTPEITDASNCYKFAQTDPDGESSESIHGVRYAHLVLSSIPPEEVDYYHAFENGHCYEIDFESAFYRVGDFDCGCVISDMDPASLIKLVLPELSFFKPRS